MIAQMLEFNTIKNHLSPPQPEPHSRKWPMAGTADSDGQDCFRSRLRLLGDYDPRRAWLENVRSG